MGVYPCEASARSAGFTPFGGKARPMSRRRTRGNDYEENYYVDSDYRVRTGFTVANEYLPLFPGISDFGEGSRNTIHIRNDCMAANVKNHGWLLHEQAVWRKPECHPSVVQGRSKSRPCKINNSGNVFTKPPLKHFALFYAR